MSYGKFSVAATFVALLACFACATSCLSYRQTLTPEASRVRFVEGTMEPPCDMIEEITVGREWFVTDERQPAISKDDVIVRMRRLAAARKGNFVVILENEPPNAKCDGFNGLGRVYRCSADFLAKVPSDAGAATAGAADAGGVDSGVTDAGARISPRRAPR